MDLLTAINYGVAFFCLVALAIAVVIVGRWAGRKTDEWGNTLVSRHLKFLDDLSTAVAMQSQAMQNMVIQQNRILEHVEGWDGKNKDKDGV